MILDFKGGIMNILHLSDIHFGRNYPEYNIKDKFENKNNILNDLLLYISNLEENMKPEHILVTGDIAWHGENREFEEAYEWFSKLLDITNLSGKDITFCVGNHDVNRKFINANLDLNIKEIRRIDDIYRFENIHQMESPIYEYDAFCEKIGMEPYSYPLNGTREYSYSIGYKDVTFPSGSIIRLFAFNTALLSAFPYSQIPDDKMWLGQKQIKTYYEYGIMPAKDVNYSIALFHHAERFLDTHEICEYDGRIATFPLLLDSVDLALCGHTETGGRPVLMKQAGGGQILTGGATYYSDTHPNAFSIICIPDNKRDMCYQPYTFDCEWKEYSSENRKYNVKTLYDMPEIGEIHEKYKLVIENKVTRYELPIKKLSIHNMIQDGKNLIIMNNHKEVLRKLDIECTASIDGTINKINVKLAPKMESDVSALLMREEYFNSLYQIINSKEQSFFKIESENGEVIYSGDNIKGEGNIDQTPEVNLTLLKNLTDIEHFFGIRLNCPYELYESDSKKISVLLDFIRKGYTNQLKIGNYVTVDISSIDKMRAIVEASRECENYYIIYYTKLWCEMYGTKFLLGEVEIVSGTFHIGKRGLKHRYRTFKNGDVRKVNYFANSNFKTYIILKRKKMEDVINLDSRARFIQVGKMKLNFGYIYEENSRRQS